MNPEERFNRIEAALEQIAQGHEDFEREHKQLLTAQILLNDTMQKLAIAQIETTDKLNGLIDLVDRHLKEGHQRA